mmetsp:Transcript_2270/g.6496  ORF Transcript_2270/g.6496 Transcript_2270/m.6496 type:complete len:543 (+) Transcript_2270:176-1804(+)|eukprot:CAMPEP_0176010062 /NCGR_PEP_ID=MMETSP0120_2-20121206/4570_1 /TAXON_ID=160619 /ORGANISM="Kryptoperidinium foliaceum, Strain CCMP 1326" /LENGTH=542 /DNA_ID=CAMNT_0017342873 /DNA_START=134 /DNA_END=1762 /DNA_ORIENTATION=-
MTLLGRWNRRNDRDRNFKAVRSPATKVRPAFAKRRPRSNVTTSVIDRFNAEQDAPFEPIEITHETAKAMEAAFRRLDVGSRPFSVNALANALNHKSVLQAHSGASNTGRMMSVLRGMTNLNIRKNRMPKEDDEIKRRYEMMKAMNRLQRMPSSLVQQISSWDEAKEALKAVVVFPPEEDQEIGRIEGKDSVADITSRFKKDMDDVFRQSEIESSSATSVLLRTVAAYPTPTKLGDSAEKVAEYKSAVAKADDMFRLRLESDTAAYTERVRKAALKEIEDKQRAKELEEEARKKALSLMRPLSKDEKQRVMRAIHGNQPASAVLSQCDTDSVQQQSMWTLQPGQWVNDEVIHYFLLMLTKRDEEMCKNDPNRKRSHFFKSFFITKLLNEGHATMDGQYEYRNVKRWSKKVPGKDLFNLDKVFFPINQGQMHWLCACAFIQEKRIEVYDSMGSSGTKYLNCIFQYLQDDYKDKKGKPMPDVDDWELVTCSDDTPQQRNGYDCGVFTCMFIDFLSKDCPLVFSQEHVNQCRERIALSILNGKAIM